MKKIILFLTTLSLFLSCSMDMSSPASDLPGEKAAESGQYIEAGEDQQKSILAGLTIASLGKKIFDSAIGSIKGKIVSFFKDKIKGILGIGTSKEADPVDLSQKSLNQIRSIMSSEINNALAEYRMTNAHDRAKERLRGIQNFYRSYIAELEAGNSLVNIRYKLNELDIATTYLETYNAFEKSFHSKYWLNINTYALAVSLRYPVLLELYSKGITKSKSYIANEAKRMHGKLLDMQNKVDSYCDTNIKIAEYSVYYSGGRSRAYCRLWDGIGKKNYYFHGPNQGGYGPDDPKRKAQEKKDELVYHYKNIIGNYRELLKSLYVLTDVNNYQN